MQSESSFAPLAYGGANRLLYNPALRLIRVDLAPFKSTLHIGRYQCYLTSGAGTLKPSKSLSLGQAILDNGSIGRELTLNTDGTVSVGLELNNGDLVKPLPNLIPILAGVTVTTTRLIEV